MKTVVIFGGSGFIGQHLIRMLSKSEYKIIIPHQRSANDAKLRFLGSFGQVVPIRFKSIFEPILSHQIKNADIVINLKTQWDERKITYEKGILGFNMKLVDIMKKNKKNNYFIFFSGIGVDIDPHSKRSDAIFKSEKYIKENLVYSSVIRPGVIIGGGDNFLKNLLPIFKISFFIPLFGGGKSSFQPVFIDDVSLGINKIIKNRKSGNYIYEFFGPHIFTYKKFYSLIAQYFGVSRFLVPIPFIIAKIIVFILEKTPYPIINREQLRLFTKDNIAVESHDQLLDLKITAQDTKEILRRIVLKNS
jgi:uncharacterized protein YbjT (DUF2867 family)